MILWQVDLAVDDALDDILTSDDPFGRLGLPKQARRPTDELSAIFRKQPERGKLHIVVQRPDGASSVLRPFFCVDIMVAPDIQDSVTKLYKKNAALFECLQVTVSNLKSWTKEDVRDNLHGGTIFNHGDDRTCPVLEGIELQLARPRTYSVSTFFLDLQHIRIFPKLSAVQESQDFHIARSYASHFDEIFVASQAQSPAVNDGREFTAFFNVLRCYHPDTERIQTKEGTSLKASTLIVYFIVPPFFSRPSEHFACKV